MKHYFVYVTFESEEQAASIAKSAVQGRLSACANIFPPHKSVYWWDDEVQTAQECAAVFKTTEESFDALKKHIKEQHSYDVPCIVALPIDAGNEDFLSWINQETKC